MNEKIQCLRGVVISVVSYYNWIYTYTAKPSVNAGSAQAEPLLSTQWWQWKSNSSRHCPESSWGFILTLELWCLGLKQSSWALGCGWYIPACCGGVTSLLWDGCDTRVYWGTAAAGMANTALPLELPKSAGSPAGHSFLLLQALWLFSSFCSWFIGIPWISSSVSLMKSHSCFSAPEWSSQSSRGGWGGTNHQTRNNSNTDLLINNCSCSFGLSWKAPVLTVIHVRASEVKQWIN